MFSPTDPLRDLLETVILEPLAFVASVPERLAKGKAKIESQKKTANMIGRFVVPMAKRKIDAELKSVAETVRSYLTNTEAKSGSSSRSPDNSNVAPSAPDPSRSKPTAETKADASKAVLPKSAVSKAAVSKAAVAKKAKPAKSTPAKATQSKATQSKATQSKTAPAKATQSKATQSKATQSKATQSKATQSKATQSKAVTSPLPTVNDLGLDSYDDLPASSVVGLLEALTPAQLQAIATYEAAHRNRQTILGGVARLLDTAP
jgi:DNA polymerase III gamma/tau subunit